MAHVRENGDIDLVVFDTLTLTGPGGEEIALVLAYADNGEARLNLLGRPPGWKASVEEMRLAPAGPAADEPTVVG